MNEFKWVEAIVIQKDNTKVILERNHIYEFKLKDDTNVFKGKFVTVGSDIGTIIFDCSTTFNNSVITIAINQILDIQNVVFIGEEPIAFIEKNTAIKTKNVQLLKITKDSFGTCVTPCPYREGVTSKSPCTPKIGSAYCTKCHHNVTQKPVDGVNFILCNHPVIKNKVKCHK